MMKQTDFDGRAMLSVRKLRDRSLEETLGRRDRLALIEEVRSMGVDMHVIHGAQAIDRETGTAQAVSPELGPHGVLLHSLGEAALRDYGIMRTQLKLSSSRGLDAFVPLLNPVALRELGRNKHRIGQEILSPLGVYRRNTLYTGPGHVFSASDLDIAPQVVAKPNTGFASRGIGAGPPRDVYDALEGSEEPFLIEERLSFSPPLPVRGRDEHEQRRLDDANERRLNKEVRMYSFGEDQWYPVARVAYQDELKMSGDEWVFLDETSVPDEAFMIASGVKEEVDQVTQSRDTLLAVDLVYVTSMDNPEPHWEAMEVNADHYIIRPDVDKEVGLKFRRLMAKQIARKALARGNA